MRNVDREISDEILSAARQSGSKLGLRFDRVVAGVLCDLRSFVEAIAPAGVAVIVTMSAPIRVPKRTVNDLKQQIAKRFSGQILPADDHFETYGNEIHVRVLKHSASLGHSFIGFVHNPDTTPALLTDLAEQWLHSAG